MLIYECGDQWTQRPEEINKHKTNYYIATFYVKNTQRIFFRFNSEYSCRYSLYNTKYQELLGSVVLEAVHVPVAYTAPQTGYSGQGTQSVPHPPAAELPVAGWYGVCQIEIRHPYHKRAGEKNRYQ